MCRAITAAILSRRPALTVDYVVLQALFRSMVPSSSAADLSLNSPSLRLPIGVSKLCKSLRCRSSAALL